MKNTTLFIVFVCFLGGLIPAKAQITKAPKPLKAINDTLLLRTDRTQQHNLLINDKGARDNGVKLFSITSDAKGTVNISNRRGLAVLEYTPPEGAKKYDMDIFSYEICKGKDSCSTAQVVAVVCPPGNARYPEVVDTVLSINTPLTLSYDSYELQFSEKPDTGKVAINEQKSSFSYIAPEQFTGKVFMEYSVYDVHPICEATHEASYELTAYFIPSDTDNQAPVAVTDEITSSQRGKIKIAVLNNDYDPENTLVNKIEKATMPKNGKLRRTPKVFTYTPDSGFYGTDSFTYTICDYNGSCTTGEVIIHIKKPGNK